jgi:hypothetical protein
MSEASVSVCEWYTVCFGAPPQTPRSFVAPFFLRLGGYEKIIGRRCAPLCFGAPPQAPRSFVAPFFLRLGGYEKIIGRRCAPILPDDRRSADGVFPGECDWCTEILYFGHYVVCGGRMPNAECRMPNVERTLCVMGC